MSCPMVAVTGGGTTFGCAGISLTEVGMAVLDEGGNRLGFVPYDSLSYVVPAGGAEAGAAMTVRTTDGSEFSCASISQTGGGVAMLNQSGARVGFVPYDTLQYVLPEGKTGSTLPPDCELPPGVVGAGDAERATGDGAASEEPASAGGAQQGSSPQQGGAQQQDSSQQSGAQEPAGGDGNSPKAGTENETEGGVSGGSEGVWEDARGQDEQASSEAAASTESSAGSTASGSASSAAGEAAAPESSDEAGDASDSLWEDAEESDESGIAETPLGEEGSDESAVSETPLAEAEGDAAGGSEETQTETEANVDAEAGANTDAEANAEIEAGDTQQAEREAAGESEMQVEWSFGEYEE